MRKHPNLLSDNRPSSAMRAGSARPGSARPQSRQASARDLKMPSYV